MDLLGDAWILFVEDRYAEAEQAFRTLAEDPSLNDAEQAQAQFGLGYALAFSGEFAEARELYRQLRQQAAAQGDAGAEHRALHQLGMVERMSGDWQEAESCFEVEAQMIQALGAPDLAGAINAYEQGLVALHLDRFEVSRTWFERALESARRTDDPVAVGCAFRGLGDWALRQGDRKQAMEMWEEARQAFEQAGSTQALTDLQHRFLQV